MPCSSASACAGSQHLNRQSGGSQLWHIKYGVLLGKACKTWSGTPTIFLALQQADQTFCKYKSQASTSDCVCWEKVLAAHLGDVGEDAMTVARKASVAAEARLLRTATFQANNEQEILSNSPCLSRSG